MFLVFVRRLSGNCCPNDDAVPLLREFVVRSFFLGEATLVELMESFTIRLSSAAVRTLIQSSPQRCCKVFDIISVKLTLSTGVSGGIDIIIIHQKHLVKWVVFNPKAGFSRL